MKFTNLFCLIILFLSISSCSKSVSKDDKQLEKIKGDLKPVEVSVQLLHKTDFQKQLISNGKIIANQQGILRFQSSGILNSIRIENGLVVQKGDTLSTLQNRQQEINLAKSEIDIERAKNDILEHLIMAGYSSWHDTINLSEEAYNEFKIRTGYQRACLELQQSKLDFNKTYLIAPFSGIISNLEKQEFDWINAGEEFCTLYTHNNLAVEFKLLEMEIANIYLNQKVKVRPYNQKELELEAVIHEINPNVDKNGLVKVKAQLLVKNKTLLFTGLNMQIIIEHSIPSQWIIPKEALVLRSNREVIFHHQNGLAKWVYVNILYENETQYAISAAKSAQLFDQMQIIVTNNLNLAHDARVGLVKN